MGGLSVEGRPCAITPISGDISPVSNRSYTA